MKQILIILSILLINSCHAQKPYLKNKNMQYFDEKNFNDWEQDTEYSSIANHKFLQKDNQRVWIDYEKSYIIVKISDIINPYTYSYHYDLETKRLISSGISFYEAQCGLHKTYDINGKMIKKKNEDISYKFSINDMIKKFREEYKLDLLNKKNIELFIRLKPSEDIDFPFYMVRTVADKKNFRRSIYLINADTGKTEFTMNFEEYENINPIKEYLKIKKGVSFIYKMHNGVTYNRAEWQAHEEKEYEAYCKRKGKTYIP